MAVEQVSELQRQIDERSKEIYSDSYAMSIGEVIHMYRDQEIAIQPEFQRYFRWGIAQKSRLIESILLGIPIPPIFVAQRPDGVWDVVDGLQRLATILEFVGELRDENDEKAEPLVLEAAPYLRALDGLVWQPTEGQAGLTQAQQLAFKRAKLQFNIILATSSPDTKYELFQRLNTGGSFLSEQEVRNCMLFMQGRQFYDLLKEFSEHSAFRRCVPLSERQVAEQYDVELALRFIVLRRAEPDDLKGVDIADYLTKRMSELAADPEFDYEAERQLFECVFTTLAEAAEENCFRKWDPAKQSFQGAFSVSAYELVSTGMAAHCEGGTYHGDPTSIVDKIKSFWSDDEYRQNTGSGVRASTRLPVVVKLGRQLFGD